MADTKISNLPAATVSATSIVPFVEGGATSQDSALDLANLTTNHLGASDQTVSGAGERSVTLGGDLITDTLNIQNASATDVMTVCGTGVISVGTAPNAADSIRAISTGLTSAFRATGSGTYGFYANGSMTIGVYGVTSKTSGTGVRASTSATAGTNKAINSTATGSGATTNIGAELAASGATNNYAINITAGDIKLDTTTGSKIGVTTSDKLAFWNTTPIVQPTTAYTAATFAANTSGISDDTATWDSYTIGAIVGALRGVGILA